MFNKTTVHFFGVFVIATTSAQALFHLDAATSPTYRFDFAPLDYVQTVCVYGGNVPYNQAIASFTDIAPGSTCRIQLFDLSRDLIAESCVRSATETLFCYDWSPLYVQNWVGDGVGVEVTMLSGSADLRQLTAYATRRGILRCNDFEFTPYEFYQTTITVVPEPSVVGLASLGMVVALGIYYQRRRHKRPSKTV